MVDKLATNRRAILKSAAFAAAIPALATGCSVQSGEASTEPQDGKMRKAYMDGPDGQIHYWTAGQGPDLFLIHQSNKSGEEYVGLIPYLADHYRMIVMDLPGHGHSDNPSAAHTVDSLTAAAIAMADHLKLGKFHIFGHHGGAIVAMNMAAKLPDRVIKTILSGKSGPKTAEKGKEYKTTILARDIPLDWEGKSLARTWERYASLRSEGARVEDILLPYLMTVRTGIRPFNVYETYLDWDMNTALKGLTGPVLLVQAEKDPYVSHQDAMLALLPNGKRVVVPECGAYWAYDRPKDCADTIRSFLG